MQGSVEYTVECSVERGLWRVVCTEVSMQVDARDGYSRVEP